MKTRIGILTYHHVVNDGAVLQAYCLQKKVAEIYPEANVEIVDFRMKVIEKRDRYLGFFQTRNPYRALFNMKRYLHLRESMRKLRMSSKRLVSDSFEAALSFIEGQYDLLVVGSDEIWKVEAVPFARPFPNIYWLDKRLSEKKVSYAASANKNHFRNLSDSQKTIISETLATFNAISVRDAHTEAFVREVAGEKIEVTRVPDPTFLVDIEGDDISEILKKRGFDFQKPTMGFSLNTPLIKEEFYTKLKKAGWQLVGLTGQNPYCDINLGDAVGAFGWAGVFKYLDFFVTHLFHGTIFALKNDVPVLSMDLFANKDYETKIESLLRDFEMSNYCFRPECMPKTADNFLTVIAALKDGFDPAKVSAHRKRLRDKGETFISSWKQWLK